MRILITGWLFITGFLLVTSCAYKQSQVLFADHKTIVDTTTRYFSATPSVYRIQPQDILQIRNLQNISLIAGSSASSTTGSSNTQSTEFQVEDDSTVALPVLGHVRVAGLTRPEAAKLIEDQYRKSLLRDPIIEVKIINLKVTIFGEVGKQGNYILTKDRTTLTDILGEASGITDKANETNIKIVRGTGTNQQVAYVNLRDINTLSRQDIILQNNDIIYISQNHRAIRAEKVQNLSTIVQPVLLLINTALIVYTLIHR